MEKVKLSASLRKVFGKKTKSHRKEGQIPSVVYGKGIDTIPLWVNELELKRTLKQAGESTIIDLSIGGKNNRNVLIHEIQRDPVSDNFMHLDFYQIRMDEKITTGVELEFIGEAPAVKEAGGILIKSLDEIEVRCFPADLPSKIVVDISSLKQIDDRIAIKDLKLSEKIEIDLDPEIVVVVVSPPRSQEEIDKLEEKVEEDVTKVEGVAQPEAEGDSQSEEKTE